MDEKKYKLICVRKGKTNYARTNNRKNVTLGSYNGCGNVNHFPRMNKLLEKRCLIWNRCGSSFADGQRLMVLLFDALFTRSPSDNCSDKEDFAAMWGLHEYLVWTSGNSWLNHSSSCFSSWTLFLPVEVSTVKAIFLHSDMHILNLFLSWSMLNGKLPSSYFWSNSLSTSACISAFFKFFVLVKINFLL